MRFEIHRDGRGPKILRKVCIELFDESGALLDCRFTHSFPLFSFSKRLERKKKRMLRCAAIMQAAEKGV